MKVRLLRQAKRAILAEPELYDQAVPPTSQATCNTPCCIFGWICWLADPKDWRSKSCSEMAVLAGLSDEQFSRLYMEAGAWPKPFSDDYFKAKDAAERARVAANRIEHFISTGGEE